MIYWVEMKILLIQMIIFFHIVEKTLLKNCDYTKFVQIMNRAFTQHTRLYVFRHTYFMTQLKDYNWLPKHSISKKMNYINDYCYW